MSNWIFDSDRVDYACDFRKEAKKVEQKNGQNIVSHTSVTEVQAPSGVKSMIEWRCEDSE